MLELTVINQAGRQSSDTVAISTTNSSPIAYAGDDRPITAAGTTVQLDGSQSYDLDGDPLTFAWVLLGKPAGSAATLGFSSNGPAFPTFLADVYGSYVVQLVVSDYWASSEPDTVTISFENLKPIADAGVSGSADVDTLVTLDGSASSDPNGDALSYGWMLVSWPPDSAAAISDATSVSPSFTPDKAGTYMVQLIVNDGLLASDPSTVQIQAVMTQSAAVATVADVQAAVAALPASAFKNANMRNTLNNKLNAVIAKIEAGDYASALDKLENDILGKTDGCAATSPAQPDSNDWLKSCSEQAVLYPLVLDTIAAVLALM